MISEARRIDRQDRRIGQVRDNGIEPVRDEIIMSLPVETGASTAGRTKVGNSGLRVAGQGLGQVPRPGRILRRVGPTWIGPSVPGSEVMRDPGISAERQVAIVVLVAPEAEAPVAVVLEAAAVGGLPAEGADVKIKNK